ncbi:hypothetical protein WH47_02270 [Habropoda laboriosa]|uniref:RNA-directed DNA polymerase from mobile element jockey n=1 Tax=Habropoda laboriosa TaxID=597456 RepID=A0A0L7QYU2_9HYME|nr:hypothetical protein WH47_02270 [Habropoda laboriosa]
MRVGDSCVGVGSELKYLGLVLDSRWHFGVHFGRLVPREDRVAAALGRLLPNLGGPEKRIRRLYVGVVRSMILYRSPVWVRDLVADRRSKDMLHRIERRSGRARLPHNVPRGDDDGGGLGGASAARPLGGGRRPSVRAFPGAPSEGHDTASAGG